MIAAKEHSVAAGEFIRTSGKTDWHNETLWHVREKRDKIAATVPEWEHLRDLASEIKLHTLSHLDRYLIEFEANARKNGVEVHWAADGDEHNRILLEIIRANGVKNVVKSKSMLTEECHLNEFLKERGFDVVDTDLGERIVQFRDEAPSHIVLPAIHLKKEEVSDTFHQHLGTEKGNNDPQYLTSSARVHLREKFVHADLAITGVNFAIAETGGVVVATNEGNADMGVHSCRIHVACMGIEKLLPRMEHLGVFLRLLARSATGQPITTYSSHFHKAVSGGQFHIIIVDNKRSQQLGRADFWTTLKCIRCGACFNTCPVYRRSGGHSYHNAVAGPIGAILAPNMDIKANRDLPFASTLCGSCNNVCPVKIDIAGQLWKWRQEVGKQGLAPPAKTMAMYGMAWLLDHPGLFGVLRKSGRLVARYLPFVLKNRLNPWYKGREMMEIPQQGFHEWLAKNRPKK